MHIEEKRHMSLLTSPQLEDFKEHKKRFTDNPKYHGFFIIRFQNTSPDDGKIYISEIDAWAYRCERDWYGQYRRVTFARAGSERIITRCELIKFLSFEPKENT